MEKDTIKYRHFDHTRTTFRFNFNFFPRKDYSTPIISKERSQNHPWSNYKFKIKLTFVCFRNKLSSYSFEIMSF